MIDDVKKGAEQKMQKSVEALKPDLAKMRTGRAHTGLLDHIHVDYYGTSMPLNAGRQRHAGRSADDRRAAVGEEDDSRSSRRRSAIPISVSIRRRRAT